MVEREQRAPILRSCTNVACGRATNFVHVYICVFVCVCVCVCARARACSCMCYPYAGTSRVLRSEKRIAFQRSLGSKYVRLNAAVL